MLSVNNDFKLKAKSKNRPVRAGAGISWLKTYAGADWFSIGISTIGGNDVIKGTGSVVSEADNYAYYDESDYLMSLEYDRWFEEPVFSISRGLCDIILDNNDDRFTPGVDATIGDYIKPRRPLRAYAGFKIAGVDIMPQIFVGTIVEFPKVDNQAKTATIHAIDFTEVLWNMTVEQNALFENKRTDELIEELLTTNVGLSIGQYLLDTGTVTIPFAFFEKGQKIGDIISKLCEAEQATFYVDEHGIFHFEIRTHWNNLPHTNMKFLKAEITAFTNGDRKWYPTDIAVSSSTVYNYKIKYRSSIASVLSIREDDGLGNYTYQDLVWPEASSEWVEVSGSFVTGAGTATLTMWQAIAAVGWIEIDDMVITEEASDTNLISNYSAELGAGSPTDWNQGGYGTNTASLTWETRTASLPDLIITDDIVIKEEQPNVENIVNVVEVTAKPRAVVGADESIFDLPDTREIAAGATIEVWCNYENPVYSVDTPTAGVGAGSYFTGNTQADGLGTDKSAQLGVTITNFSNASKVEIQNNDAGVVHLTELIIFGRPAKITQELYLRKTDATSITNYEERVVSIDNNFIQSYATANDIADAIIADRATPADYLKVTILGQPHLQLGDRVERNSNSYFVIRIKTKITLSDGMVQELTLVKRTIAA